jgi:endonuclease/exonuclease/phosphatase (EEP) superfamily protein YafD
VVVLWVILLALLVPAVGLTIARLVQPEAGFWVQAVAFTPFGLVLYGVALVVALLRLLVLRRWRSATSIVVVLAVAGLGVHVWWFAPLVTGANPPAAEGAEPLTVMTANVYRGQADGIEVVREASEQRVDLLVVEEITVADLADMDRAGLAELLPYRVGEPQSGGGGTMVFARAVLGTPKPIGTLHEGWAVPMGDLEVLAVHPTAPTDGAEWRDDQAAVARAVDEFDPDLVVGDFNATVDHAAMGDLADAGYRDVGELANQGWQPTWPSGDRFEVLGVSLPSFAQIDHVLVGPRLAALSMHTVEIPGSDHRAVVAEVARK